MFRASKQTRDDKKNYMKKYTKSRNKEKYPQRISNIKKKKLEEINLARKMAGLKPLTEES